MIGVFEMTRVTQRSSLRHKATRTKPVLLDLSDGLYRSWLLAEDTAHLAVLFPSSDGEPPLVGRSPTQWDGAIHRPTSAPVRKRSPTSPMPTWPAPQRLQSHAASHTVSTQSQNLCLLPRRVDRNDELVDGKEQ